MKSNKTHDEWKELVFKYNKSGLSMAEFSRNNNLKPTTFVYWTKMFNTNVNKTSNFVKHPNIEIRNYEPVHLSINNIKLEVPADAPTEKIARIISVLREKI